MWKDQRGQTMAIVAFGVGALVGLAGISLEIAHGYYAIEELQASTNAAALAGAAGLPDTAAATNYINQYSSQYSGNTGNENTNTLMLQNVTATPTFSCLTSVENLGVGCLPGASCPSAGCNALSVTQTAQVPTWIGTMFGVPVFNIKATATAAMAGGSNTPWNIAIIVDTTSSMSSTDKSGQCTGTQISCALLGVQALLQLLDPCAQSTTCTKTTTPVDSVSLFVFPPVTSATATKDYVCNTSNPSIVPYTFQNVTPGSSQNLNLPAGDTYQIISFANGTNYKSSDSSSTLNASSPLAIAAGASGIGACSGLQAPGGEGTYYAQVIYAAQAALVAQQNTYKGSQNAMIILSDGDATACNTATSTGNDCSNGGSSQIVAASGTLNGTGTKTSNSTGYQSYTYPSALGECGQAVQAAIDAATNTAYNNAGSFTNVYTIGYGAETSGGCLTDAKYSATLTGGGGNWASGDQPCQALAAMASQTSYFFSDDESGSGLGCEATAPSNQNLKKLTAIFTAITDTLTVPRLVPNGSS
jgi:hypothetical protein